LTKNEQTNQRFSKIKRVVATQVNALAENLLLPIPTTHL